MKRIFALGFAVTVSALGFDSNLVTKHKTPPVASAGVRWGADPNDTVSMRYANEALAAPIKPVKTSRLKDL